MKLSSFGTFLQEIKRERIGRNPKTGVEATITPRKVLVFKRIAHHARPDQRQRFRRGVRRSGDLRNWRKPPWTSLLQAL